jgi:hypothetical protein
MNSSSLPTLYPGLVGGSEGGHSLGEGSALETPQSLENQQPFGMAKVFALTPPREWMRWCLVCESEERFIATLECRFGLIGCCSTCGNERIAPFTRAVSGVA